jgi:hypothetical protein
MLAAAASSQLIRSNICFEVTPVASKWSLHGQYEVHRLGNARLVLVGTWYQEGPGVIVCLM